MQKQHVFFPLLLSPGFRSTQMLNCKDILTPPPPALPLPPPPARAPALGKVESTYWIDTTFLQWFQPRDAYLVRSYMVCQRSFE